MPIGKLHTPILVKQSDGLRVMFRTYYIGELSEQMISEDEESMKKMVEAVKQ